MSTAFLELEPPVVEDGYIEAGHSEQDSIASLSQANELEHFGSLTERWDHRDPIEELVDELRRLGRDREAERVRAVLDASASEDDALMRAFVSERWADDWASAEDAVYDSL